MQFDNNSTINKRSAEINKLIDEESLPNSLLFYGESGSSRLNTALDVSFKILNQEEKRLLLDTDRLIILPSRNLELRLKAASSIFISSLTRSSQLFYLETLRIILYQYHQALIASYSNQVKSYFSTSSDITELIYENNLDKERTFERKEAEKIVTSINKLVTPAFINKGKKASSISIDEIREIQNWFSEESGKKIVIIENLENANENVKNSLLKILEEPKKDSYIILISNNYQKLPDTILSRLRKFNFPSLSKKEINSILFAKFLETMPYDSLSSFFFDKGAGEEDKEKLERNAKLFSEALLKKKKLLNEEKESLFSQIEKLNASDYFKEKVAFFLSKELEDNLSPSYIIKEASISLNKWSRKEKEFNLSLRQSLDGALREADFG